MQFQKGCFIDFGREFSLLFRIFQDDGTQNTKKSGSSNGRGRNTQQEPNHCHSQRFDHHEINQALEKSLIRYGNGLYEKSILPIFALYDNRLKFSAIRANIKSLKARIKRGKESRMMMKILRKTVKGNEKKLEKAQEKRTMTPPSSDNEDESEYEMSFSSKGRGVRTLQEQSMTPPSSENEGESESEKSWSSKGRGVRTQHEHFCQSPVARRDGVSALNKSIF